MAIAKSVIIYSRKENPHIIRHLWLLFIFLGCSGQKKHVRTDKLNIGCKTQLYVEVFASKSSLKTAYLTDSSTFRIKSGTYDDENGYISYSCLNDSITIIQKEKLGLEENFSFKNDSILLIKKDKDHQNLKIDTLITKKSETFSLQDLRSNHKF